jgi:pyruvate/2-oxoglutarate dehydrogenase complex dihydrolipoamide dehydrogenase (E3) component
MVRVRQRKSDIVDSFRNSGQQHIEKTDGVDLIFGEARFVGPMAVAVTLDEPSSRQLSASRFVFINTGARPGRSPDWTP